MMTRTNLGRRNFESQPVGVFRILKSLTVQLPDFKTDDCSGRVGQGKHRTFGHSLFNQQAREILRQRDRFL